MIADHRDLVDGARDRHAGRGIERGAEGLGVERDAAADGMAARQDRRHPLLGRRPSRLGDGAKRHDRRERDHHRPDRQPGPRPVARQVCPPKESLGAEEPLERAADDAPERLEDVGRRHRASDEQRERQRDRHDGGPDVEESGQRDAHEDHEQLGEDERSEAVGQSTLRATPRTERVEG